jgi:ketosteroid isomerase-like protein
MLPLSPRSARASIILLLAVVCASTSKAAEPENISALLLAKTQAFSDAGQRGDATVLKSLLDDKVVFFNEDGDMASKADILAGAAPSPNTDVKMAVTEWHCEVHGDVAVVSFIDDQTKDLHGQIFHAQYRSVETWEKNHGAWLMIGSQTLALPIDPAAVTLPAATLDQYVGTYAATPKLRAVFTRDGTDLSLSVNGGPPSVQRAELRDVLFTPGTPRTRRIFQRDAKGNILGFISRRDGHDIVFRRVSFG